MLLGFLDVVADAFSGFLDMIADVLSCLLDCGTEEVPDQYPCALGEEQKLLTRGWIPYCPGKPSECRLERYVQRKCAG